MTNTSRYFSQAKKRTSYAMCFNDNWLNEPEFKVWLAQNINGRKSSYCKCCRVVLKNANKSMLVKHMNTVKQKKL